MQNIENWDWAPGKKIVADLGQWHETYEAMEEPYASPDGEKIAAIVQTGEEAFSVCVNGSPWAAEFDKIWHLRFCPDNRAVALVSDTAMWSVAVDGAAWQNWYEFVWDTKFGACGGPITVAAQNSRNYFAVTDDQPWESAFYSLSNLTVSTDGKVAAAVVQSVPAKEGDIAAFQEGVFSVAVNGTPWPTQFFNAWQIAFSSDNRHVATDVRLSLYDFTIAVDGTPWKNHYAEAWRPQFHPVDHSVTAPVRVSGRWGLAKDGELFWRGRYVQLWHHFYSPTGDRIAAIAAPEYGQWTIAEDDKSWSIRFNELVTDAVYSPDGNRIACVGKHNGKWHIAVDDKIWPGGYDMAWPPVFSPDGAHVAAKVETDGRYAVVVNGNPIDWPMLEAWDPVFSPDSRKVMVKGVDAGPDKGKYCRYIFETDALHG